MDASPVLAGFGYRDKKWYIKGNQNKSWWVMTVRPTPYQAVPPTQAPPQVPLSLSSYTINSKPPLPSPHLPLPLCKLDRHGWTYSSQPHPWIPHSDHPLVHRPLWLSLRCFQLYRSPTQIPFSISTNFFFSLLIKCSFFLVALISGCMTFWCPCITYGRIAEIVDRGSSSN